MNADNRTRLLSDEDRYKLLNLLEKDSKLSQRELAGALGISLGKVNFCVQALIEKGLVKARNFRNSKNKSAYMYYLTPRGFDEKARLTVSFLRRKTAEYEALTQEIERLRREVIEAEAHEGAGHDAAAGRSGASG
jgi:EPS-associated MarR family transcriptional regulator